MIKLINYAAGSHFGVQKRNTEQALQNGVESVVNYGFHDLDDKFKGEYAHILDKSHGAGLWCWKPYIILKALLDMAPDDTLIYSDSDIEIIGSVLPVVETHRTKCPEGLMCFRWRPGMLEQYVTKKDVFIILGCDGDEGIRKSVHLMAGFHLWRKTDTTIRFLQEWLLHLKDLRMSGDWASTLGKNWAGFMWHYNDQSVFSVLTKLYGIRSWRLPSRWEMETQMSDEAGTYPPAINVTDQKD
ncbi:MAG: hypothetical protein ACOYB3_01305 [Azonexus sp.]